MINLLLIALLAMPSYSVKKDLSPRQVRAKAHRIVQMLKRQDPKVLRSVLYYMGWVPKLKFKRENCKKDKYKKDLQDINDWQLDMLLDMSGIKRRKR